MKILECRPSLIFHFRGGQLSSLFAQDPSKWLKWENFVALVTKKRLFEPLRGVFGKKWRKLTPPKMTNEAGSTFWNFHLKCSSTEIWQCQDFFKHARLLSRDKKFWKIFLIKICPEIFFSWFITANTQILKISTLAYRLMHSLYCRKLCIACWWRIWPTECYRVFDSNSSLCDIQLF